MTPVKLDAIRKRRHGMSGVDADNETIALWDARADREDLLFYVDQLHEVIMRLRVLLREDIEHDGITHYNWRQDWLKRVRAELEGK